MPRHTNHYCTAGAIGPSRAVFLTVLNRSTIYESPFLRLLDSSLQFKATEPKDKIFALLHHQIHRKGNRNQYGSCQGIPHLALGIDYSLTISQVNREVALQSILQYKSLEALNYAWRIRLPRSRGPSWVAEWHSELPDRRQPLRPCLYNAAGLTSPQDVQLVAPNALSLKGVYIDTVLERDPIVDMQKWFLRSTCRTNNNASNDVQRARKLESLSALLVRDAIYPSNEMLAKRLDQADRVKCMKSFAAYLSGLFAEHKDEAFLIALQGNRMCDAVSASLASGNADSTEYLQLPHMSPRQFRLMPHLASSEESAVPIKTM
ncbi:hypothetical protein CHU98_g8306 [Xylaria longipes]|nr:hypothetical protein CHU98_g8306 [Xylaria longipes]